MPSCHLSINSDWSFRCCEQFLALFNDSFFEKSLLYMAMTSWKAILDFALQLILYFKVRCMFNTYYIVYIIPNRMYTFTRRLLKKNRLDSFRGLDRLYRNRFFQITRWSLKEESQNMFEESLILLKESISIQLVDSPKVIR